MEKLAEGLQKLGEDDLLHVVQMVHDNKTETTYTKNDVESMFQVAYRVRKSIDAVYRWRVPCRPIHVTR